MKSFVTLLLLLVAFLWVSAAQQALPKFEAATIKPTGRSDSGVTGGCRGVDSKLAPTDPRNNVPLGRCVIKAARLSHLIPIAFGVPLRRISGLPDWDFPNRFDVEGKAEDAAIATEKQLIAMLQTFLTEQFKLTMRREISDGPIFGLVAPDGGSKNMRQSEQLGSSMVPNRGSLVFKGFTMHDLADFLSTMPAIDRPVRDLTQMTGRFDFTLDVLDSTDADVRKVKFALASWESVFSDIQSQLGLRLEAMKGPVE